MGMSEQKGRKMQHQCKERLAVMLHMPFRGINMELIEYIFFSTGETKKMPKKNKKKKKKKNKNKKRKNNGKQEEEPEEKKICSTAHEKK